MQFHNVIYRATIKFFLYNSTVNINSRAIYITIKYLGDFDTINYRVCHLKGSTRIHFDF